MHTFSTNRVKLVARKPITTSNLGPREYDVSITYVSMFATKEGHANAIKKKDKQKRPAGPTKEGSQFQCDKLIRVQPGIPVAS